MAPLSVPQFPLPGPAHENTYPIASMSRVEELSICKTLHHACTDQVLDHGSCCCCCSLYWWESGAPLVRGPRKHPHVKTAAAEQKVSEQGAFGLSEGYSENFLISTLGFEKVLGRLRQDWAAFLGSCMVPLLRGPALGLMLCLFVLKLLIVSEGGLVLGRAAASGEVARHSPLSCGTVFERRCPHP